MGNLSSKKSKSFDVVTKEKHDHTGNGSVAGVAGPGGSNGITTLSEKTVEPDIASGGATNGGIKFIDAETPAAGDRKSITDTGVPVHQSSAILLNGNGSVGEAGQSHLHEANGSVVETEARLINGFVDHVPLAAPEDDRIIIVDEPKTSTITVEKIVEIHCLMDADDTSRTGGKSDVTIVLDNLEVSEYAVSEPDSEASAGLEDLLHENDIHQTICSASMEVSELTMAELENEMKKVSVENSPVGVVLEPSSNLTPGGSTELQKPNFSPMEDLKEDERTSTIQEIVWTLGGEVVFIRGSFTEWTKKPMNRVGDEGSFSYMVSVTPGDVYYYNFTVDDVEERIDPGKEQIRYYVAENEEEVNCLYVE